MHGIGARGGTAARYLTRCIFQPPWEGDWLRRMRVTRRWQLTILETRHSQPYNSKPFSPRPVYCCVCLGARVCEHLPHTRVLGCILASVCAHRRGGAGLRARCVLYTCTGSGAATCQQSHANRKGPSCTSVHIAINTSSPAQPFDKDYCKGCKRACVRMQARRTEKASRGAWHHGQIARHFLAWGRLTLELALFVWPQGS